MREEDLISVSTGSLVVSTNEIIVKIAAPGDKTFNFFFAVDH